MQLSLDSEIVNKVLLEQLNETNENRFYLMAVVRQLEHNHKQTVEAIEKAHQAELTASQDAHLRAEETVVELNERVDSLNKHIDSLLVDIESLQDRLDDYC